MTEKNYYTVSDTSSASTSKQNGKINGYCHFQKTVDLPLSEGRKKLLLEGTPQQSRTKKDILIPKAGKPSCKRLPTSPVNN